MVYKIDINTFLFTQYYQALTNNYVFENIIILKNISTNCISWI